MNPRQVLIALAGVLVLAGIVLGMRTVSADDISCGSVFSPSSSEARIADGGEAVAGTLEGATPDLDASNNQASCKDALSNSKPFTYGSLGLGVVALIAAFVVAPTASAEGRQKPSMWR